MDLLYILAKKGEARWYRTSEMVGGFKGEGQG